MTSDLLLDIRALMNVDPVLIFNLFLPQYGGWWTSVRGWDGWVWLSTCCSASWRRTTSLRSTALVWNVCREQVPAHRLHLLLSLSMDHYFLCGCGHWSSCCHTCSSSSSCSHAQGRTPALLDTVCFLSVSPFCTAAAMPPNWPITGQQDRSSTRRGRPIREPPTWWGVGWQQD